MENRLKTCLPSNLTVHELSVNLKLLHFHYYLPFRQWAHNLRMFNDKRWADTLTFQKFSNQLKETVKDFKCPYRVYTDYDANGRYATVYLFFEVVVNRNQILTSSLLISPERWFVIWISSFSRHLSECLKNYFNKFYIIHS